MKIFCVGLSKTGTTSLTAALGMLGFRAAHWIHTSKMFVYSDDGIEIDYNQFEFFDAFADTPIARIYPELEQKFPNSKFILTVRGMEEWKESFRSQFSIGVEPGFPSRLHLDLYGTTGYDSHKCENAFHKHNDGVKQYFRGRESKLLVLDIPAGDGWEKLCPFLDKPIPMKKFPKEFTREDRLRPTLRSCLDHLSFWVRALKQRLL